MSLAETSLADPTAGSTPTPSIAAPAPAPDPQLRYGFDLLERSAIVPSLTNPRTNFDPAALAELAESIKADGLAQPILVRPLPASRLGETFADRRKGDPLPTHEVVAGERRYRACGLAGLRTIPATIRSLTDAQVLRIQLVENLQRNDLHPLEEAAAYQRILDLPDNAGKKREELIEDLANQVKKSTRYVYQTLQLLKLAEFPRKVFQEGKLHRTVALQVATIGGEAQQIEATRVLAGLARTGTSTEVVDDPKSQREAARYVRDNFRLLLSKAPFPVKVEFAGIGACSTCDKMSANARDLFEEGEKVADTCLDRSCWGKKSTAHFAKEAKAAEEKGQRVITGKEAKKLLPYDDSPDYLVSSEYQELDARRYEGTCGGKTVQQLLGAEMPAPVLIHRPDGQGFVKALPTKQVDELLKAKGLLKKPTGSNSYAEKQRAEQKKAELEKKARWAMGEALVAAARKVPAQAPAAFAPGSAAELLSELLLPVAIQLRERLDHEARRRCWKLLGWDANFLDQLEDMPDQGFRSLEPVEFNAFIVAACIASELHFAQYYHPALDNVERVAEALGVDAEAIRQKVLDDAKAAEKAKKAAAAKKAAPAAKKSKGAGAKPTTAGSAAPAGDKAPVFAIGDRVRFKQGLKGPTGHLRKCCGREGTLTVKSGMDWMVRTGPDAHEVHKATSDELELVSKAETPPQQWRAPHVDEHQVMKPGDRVRLTLATGKLAKRLLNLAGRTGTLAEPCGPEAWWIDLDAVTGGKATRTPCSVHYTELEFPDGQAAAPAPQPTSIVVKDGKKQPAKPAKKAATTKGKKTDEEASQLGLKLPGGGTLMPQQAWPFPTAPKA